MNEFAVFQKFTTRAEADEVAATLQEHGITAHVAEERALLDQNIIGKQYDNYIQLQIRQSDFKLAQQILLDTTKVDLDDIPADYILRSLSKEELMDIIAKPDEWGPYNYNVALTLLQEKGASVDHQQKEVLLKKRNTELSKPRELSFYWYLFGYGFSIIGILAKLFQNNKVLWVLYSFYGIPGIVGIILGAYILLIKRTLPDGTRIYSFSKAAKKHGLYMLLLSIAALFIIIIMAAY